MPHSTRRDGVESRLPRISTSTTIGPTQPGTLAKGPKPRNRLVKPKPSQSRADPLLHTLNGSSSAHTPNSQLLSPTLTVIATPSPSPSPENSSSTEFLSSAEGRGPTHKLERVFGVQLTSESVVSLHVVRSNPKPFERHRRRSLSLSELETEVPSSLQNLMMEGKKGRNAECWIDNNYQPNDYANDGLLTPVSPIVFSDQIPTPPRRGPTLVEIGDSSTGLALVKPIRRQPDFHENDGMLGHAGFFRVTLPHQTTSESSHSIHTKDSPIESPVSPMVFSENDEDSSIILSDRWSDDDFHHSHLYPKRSKDVVSTSKTETKHPPSNALSIVHRRPSVSRGGTRNSNMRNASSTSRKERSQGWSGEWNRDNMEEVIQSLRQLK